jgi:hypothetical protein
MDQEIREKMILFSQSLMGILQLAFEGFQKPTEKFFE